jgi:hypothetical protein
MQIHLLQPAPLQKRLWQFGMAMAIVVLTVVIAGSLLRDDPEPAWKSFGHDYLAFYTAGHFVASNQSEQLYNLEATRAFQQKLASRTGLTLGDSFAPFWNPPFVAAAFRPLAALPWSLSVAVWTAFNLLCLAGACLILMHMLPDCAGWQGRWLVPLFILVSMPFWQSITHAQNSSVSLLIASAATFLWRKKLALGAGVVAGLLLYKPQLALILLGVMALTLGGRVLLGSAFSLGVYGLLTLALTPGAGLAWVEQLPANLRAIQQDATYLWERHVTLAAFWRLLLQGREPGATAFLTGVLTLFSQLVVAYLLIRAIVRVRRPMIDDPWTGQSKSVRRDRVMSAAYFCTPLLAPFYFDYDLLLLAVPLTLLAAERLAIGTDATLRGNDRLLIGSLGLMMLWMPMNPGIGAWTRVNGTVILLALCGLLLLRRALPTVTTVRLVESPLATPAPPYRTRQAA